MFRFNIILALLLPCLGWTQDYVPGEVIVKFRQGARNFSTQKAQAMSLKHLGGWSGMGLHQYAVEAGKTVTASLSELQNDPDVEYAEPNYIMRKSNEFEAQEVYTKTEIEGMSVNVQSGTFSMTTANIHAPEGWAAAAGTTSPVVAIIDSGMDMNHDALKDALWTNPIEVPGNGIDDDNNGYIDDVHGWDFVDNDNNPQDGDGHGTHVAGIVRGATQNIFANPLDPPKLQIMVLRFLDNTGAGTTANAIKAIYYASNNGARVLNNSWGGSTYSRALHEAIAYSYQQHTLFVAAAGNLGKNNDASPMYPASYDVPNILTVAATNVDDSRAYFSNFGTFSVHVGSPGVSILSTYKGNGYTYLSGTSMAAPFVSGVAAMIAREKPTMWGYQIKQVLDGASDAVSGLQVATSGRLNVQSSVLSAQSTSVSLSQPNYVLAVSSNDRGLASALANGGGSGCGRVGQIYSEFNSVRDVPRGVEVLLIFIGLPSMVVFILRRKEVVRKFDRYSIDSTVRMKVGDQEFVGKVGTISLGGAGFNMPVALREGSLITLTIASPDGKESVTVQGNIVWSTEAQNYGVSFAHLEQGVQDTIERWTHTLAKDSVR